MANFIQADALTPIQGTAGQFSPVIDRSPTAGEAINNAVTQTAQLVDTAADIYGKNRAQSLVQEEIQNLENARAVAEKGEFTAGDAVPEGVNLDQKSWDMLAVGVQSGAITQEKARLLASARLRTRIAEQPMFADRIRKAASGVLGFNIESEGARQYFAALPTEASLASQQAAGQSKKILEMRQFAQEEASLTGIPAEKIYRQMWALETSKRNKEIAELELEQGVIDSKEAFTRFNRENAKTAFTGVLGNLNKIFMEEGAVKPEVYTQALADAKSMEMQELTDKWKGDQTSAAFSAAQQVINDRYETYQTIMESVDYDKLNKIILDRNANERTLFTDQTLNDVKMINEAGGQEAVSAYFSYISPLKNETQRRQLLERFPILKRLTELQGMGPDEVSARLQTTAGKMLSEQPLDEQDREVAGPVGQDMHDNTDSPEQKTKVFDKLVQEGMKYTAVSIVTNKPPRNTSVDNITNVKRVYDEEVVPMATDLSRQVSQLSKDVNRFGEPAIQLSINEKGDIEVTSLRPLSLPQGKLEQLRGMAAKINQFNRAFDNNWGQSLGENKEQFRLKVTDAVKRGEQLTVIADQDDFIRYTVSGSENNARKAYAEMQKKAPEEFTKPFDELYDEIRRRRLEGKEAM